jgi:hypothetical protein
VHAALRGVDDSLAAADGDVAVVELAALGDEAMVLSA